MFFDAALTWTKAQIDVESPCFTYISLNATDAPLIAPKAYKKRFLELGYDESTAGRYDMIENTETTWEDRMMFTHCGR